MVALASSKVQRCGSILILTGQVQVCESGLEIQIRDRVIGSSYHILIVRYESVTIMP